MAKKKSLARLFYETRRSLEGRAHQVEKKRSRYGHSKSSYQGTQGSHPRGKAPDKSRRHRRRESREIDEQNLAEEIKGTGGLRPGEDPELLRRAREELERARGSAAIGVSGLADRIAAKRAIHARRKK